MPLRLPVRRRSKFNAEGVRHEGIYFPSKKEARRFMELEQLQRAGHIRNLEAHPTFALFVIRPTNGEVIVVGRYTPDAEFDLQVSGEWRHVIEDTKSSATRTEAYRLRKKIFEALYQVQVTEW